MKILIRKNMEMKKWAIVVSDRNRPNNRTQEDLQIKIFKLN